MTTSDDSPDFSRGEGGLLPAIAQDGTTGAVLMLAWMNAEAYAETVISGRAVYYSRSRQAIWRKGEESGNVQLVRQIRLDCDRDVILLEVEQLGGAACHTGFDTCFYRAVAAGGLQVVGRKVFDPAQVYNRTD